MGMGGKLVLCFDNDKAREMAFERLCSGRILAKICEEYAVDIFFATLPSGIKDPGEYFEDRSTDATSFKINVLDRASEWSLWHLHRILSKHDSLATVY